MEGETITIKRETLWKYSTFILAAILIVGAFVYFNNNGNSLGGNVIQNPGQQVPGDNEKVAVSADDDPVLGDKDAPVTIIEFSDYQCPFCERFYSQTLPSIKREYVDNGKVKIVYRDFPLTQIHPQAQKAAEAAECARFAGKSDDAYWKMHDKIFENQQSLSIDNLKSWAKGLGYNIDDCLDSDKFANEVDKDTQEGIAAGVQGTPAFFVNGKLLSGAQPFSVFKQAIDAELA